MISARFYISYIKRSFIHLFHLCTCNCNKFDVLHLWTNACIFDNYDQMIHQHSKTKVFTTRNISNSVNTLVPLHQTHTQVLFIFRNIIIASNALESFWVSDVLLQEIWLWKNFSLLSNIWFVPSKAHSSVKLKTINRVATIFLKRGIKFLENVGHNGWSTKKILGVWTS